MSSSTELSAGSLKAIMKGNQMDNVMMQVLGSKKLGTSNKSDNERYRLMLSDGVNMITFAMLTLQSKDGPIKGEIPKYSIIKIKKYITSFLAHANKSGEKKILIIVDCEIVKDGGLVGRQLGNPTQLPVDDTTEDNNENVNRENVKNRRDSNDGSAPPSKRQNVASTSNQSASDGLNIKDQLILPINSLNPYQNRWVIKARVLKKSDIRTWSNSRGEGKLFSMDLFDNSGEIRLTGFRDMVDKYYDYIQEDKVYYITKCVVKIANKQFSTLKNDYEMSMTNDTVVQECTDEDDQETPKVHFNFMPIESISEKEAGSTLDVIGVCKEVKDCQTIKAKSTGREMIKREILLVDQSKTSVAVTLWGKDAEHFDGHSQVIAMKSARVGEFGGAKNLSVGGGTLVKVNPDIEEAFALRGWYDNGGCNEQITSISSRIGSGSYQTEWRTFRDIVDMNLGSSEKGDYFKTKGTVLLIRGENLTYKACPNDNCNKKVVEMGNVYSCEKCGTQKDSFKYRLMGNWSIGDWTGSQWVSFFSEQCETILGKTAAEIGEMAESDPQQLQTITREAHFKQFIFTCRAKVQSYNDEMRRRTNAVRVEPINYEEYNNYLISRIQALIE